MKKSFPQPDGDEYAEPTNLIELAVWGIGAILFHSVGFGLLWYMGKI